MACPKTYTRLDIESADRVYVSAASIWEIAIKARLGKVEADPAALVAAIAESGFFELPVTASHAAGIAMLTPHHNDPFDRLLIARALSQPLKLLTSDAVLVQSSDLIVLV